MTSAEPIAPPEPWIEPAEFRGLMARVPTSVAVVTALDDGVPVGLTVGTFVSVSLDPPLVSFCAGRGSESWPRIRGAGSFGISVLADHQRDVCEALAQKGPDKFGAIDWSLSEGGHPVVEGAVAYVECRLETEIPAGDHTIVVGRVLELRAGRSEVPMVFHARRLSSVHRA